MRAATTKTKRERRIPLTPELKTTLKRLRAERKVLDIRRGGGRVFVSSTGRPMSTTMLRKRWEKALKTWGEKAPADLHWHDLRHTFASVAINAGEDLFVIGRLLGHTSPESTARYSHLLLHRQRHAVEALGASLRVAESAAG